MSHTEYLEAHHNITERAVGLAVLKLKDGKADEALDHLETARNEIDDAQSLKQASD